ncbi:hypothetical protein WJX73_010508 [Symbiochloris irregularis]|uniref:Bacterial Ig-like domain-containing protein n=1 Tax=Symbiochloris irregularis TaxID=706552 RepID=A0AAW1NT02_9CHLO
MSAVQIRTTTAAKTRTTTGQQYAQALPHKTLLRAQSASTRGPERQGKASILTVKDAQRIAQARGLSLRVNTLGPAYEVVCRDGTDTGTIVGTSSGLVLSPLKLLHCDKMEIFTRRQGGTEGQRMRGGILGLGLLVAMTVFAHGYAAGCTTAEILAINDDDAWHRRLVRHYQRIHLLISYAAGWLLLMRRRSKQAAYCRTSISRCSARQPFLPMALRWDTLLCILSVLLASQQYVNGQGPAEAPEPDYLEILQPHLHRAHAPRAMRALVSSVTSLMSEAPISSAPAEAPEASSEAVRAAPISTEAPAVIRAPISSAPPPPLTVFLAQTPVALPSTLGLAVPPLSLPTLSVPPIALPSSVTGVNLASTPTIAQGTGSYATIPVTSTSAPTAALGIQPGRKLLQQSNGQVATVLSTTIMSATTNTPWPPANYLSTAALPYPTTSPTGTVIYSEDGRTYGTAPVNAGRAVATQNLTPGVHHITTTYTGDANYSPSTSTGTYIVSAATPPSTSPGTIVLG